MNILTDIFYQHKFGGRLHRLKSIIELIMMWPFIALSKKSFFTDKRDADLAPRIFLKKPSSMRYLAAPVDLSLFKIKNKEECRKKLNLPLNKKIIIFVGRINYLKCSDILRKIIENNPEIYFIVIGRVLDHRFYRIKRKNLLMINKKPSKDLVEYYNYMKHRRRLVSEDWDDYDGNCRCIVRTDDLDNQELERIKVALDNNFNSKQQSIY